MLSIYSGIKKVIDGQVFLLATPQFFLDRYMCFILHIHYE